MVTVWETLLTFVVPPVGLYLLIALLVVAARQARRGSRYRVGEPWRYEPMFWTASPGGGHDAPPARADGMRGGARGDW